MKALALRLLRLWTRFGKILGLVNLSILLTLLWLVVVPFYALAAFVRDPLELRAARDERSMWRKAPHPKPDADNLWRQF